MRRALALVPLLAAACASGPRPVPPETPPAQRLALAETALLEAKDATATFTLASTGRFSSQVKGTLALGAGNTLKLKAEGTFGEDTFSAEIDSTRGELERTLSKGATASAHQDPVPAELKRAVVLGLTRMGLLHNVAKLVADQPVDHADGGAAEWVRAVEPKPGGPDSVDGVPCTAVAFGIEVSGKRAGEAVVCIADATGLPLERRQTVHFEAGDMEVTETLVWALSR